MNISNKKIDVSDIVSVSRYREKLTISKSLKPKIDKARSVVDVAVENKEVVYGITTGFGAFKDKTIGKDETKQLQGTS